MHSGKTTYELALYVRETSKVRYLYLTYLFK